jgi:hypothetical protein
MDRPKLIHAEMMNIAIKDGEGFILPAFWTVQMAMPTVVSISSKAVNSRKKRDKSLRLSEEVAVN